MGLAVLVIAVTACGSDAEPTPYVGTGCEDNVSWRAERDPVSGRLTTYVWIYAGEVCEEDERPAVLELYCSPRARVLTLKTRAYQRSHEVTWQVDSGAPITEDWTPANWDSPGAFRPPLSGAMIENLKSASRFTITTAATGEIVFDLSEALEAPALPNIYNCGQVGWR